MSEKGLAFDFGDMRQMVDIEGCVKSKDKAGTVSRTWTSIRRVWAKVEDQGGYERTSSEQQVSIGNTKITIRYFRGINAFDFRVRWNDRILQISNVTDLYNRKRIHVLTCLEGDANG